jgi:RsiW-degrading membrane proteinase PrsW (M82 family)
VPSVLLAAFLPGIFWIWYFHRQDRFDREPLFALVKVFVLGALAVIPAIALEYPFRSFLQGDPGTLSALWLSFGVVGLGEESLKLLAVYVGVYRSQAFDEPLDGIVYAVTGGVGFSVVENVLYISAFGLEVAPLRAVVASLAHASFSGISGYYLGRAKFSDHAFREASVGLLWAALLHGIYDFILITQLVSPLSVVILVGVLHYVLLRLMGIQLRQSPFR